MDEEEIEYDIYFQGAKEELFTFLYPLTGPNSPIFDHLNLQAIKYDNKSKKFNFDYAPEQFTNIDRQTDTITYESVSVPTHSNYFYSKNIPGERALVWRNVKRMTELRPNCAAREEKKQEKGNDEMEEEVDKDGDKNELILIGEGDPDNKVINAINDANVQPLNRNWDVSKQEYISRLCE